MNLMKDFRKDESSLLQDKHNINSLYVKYDTGPLYIKGGTDRFGIGLGISFSSNIGGADIFLILQDPVQGGRNAVADVCFTQVVEHHQGRKEQSSGIGQIFPCNIGSRTMHRFKHGGIIPDVGRPCDTKTTYNP